MIPTNPFLKLSKPSNEQYRTIENITLEEDNTFEENGIQYNEAVYEEYDAYEEEDDYAFEDENEYDEFESHEHDEDLQEEEEEYIPHFWNQMMAEREAEDSDNSKNHYEDHKDEEYDDEYDPTYHQEYYDDDEYYGDDGEYDEHHEDDYYTEDEHNNLIDENEYYEDYYEDEEDDYYVENPRIIPIARQQKSSSVKSKKSLPASKTIRKPIEKNNYSTGELNLFQKVLAYLLNTITTGMKLLSGWRGRANMAEYWIFTAVYYVLNLIVITAVGIIPVTISTLFGEMTMSVADAFSVAFSTAMMQGAFAAGVGGGFSIMDAFRNFISILPIWVIILIIVLVIINLLLIIIVVTVTARRLHDSGKTSKWLLAPYIIVFVIIAAAIFEVTFIVMIGALLFISSFIVILIFTLLPSKKSANKYGKYAWTPVRPTSKENAYSADKTLAIIGIVITFAISIGSMVYTQMGSAPTPTVTTSTSSSLLSSSPASSSSSWSSGEDSEESPTSRWSNQSLPSTEDNDSFNLRITQADAPRLLDEIEMEEAISNLTYWIPEAVENFEWYAEGVQVICAEIREHGWVSTTKIEATLNIDDFMAQSEIGRWMENHSTCEFQW